MAEVEEGQRTFRGAVQACRSIALRLWLVSLPSTPNIIGADDTYP